MKNTCSKRGIAPYDFIIGAKIGLDLLNLFIFDQVLHVQHVVVGQKIRPTTTEKLLRMLDHR